MNTDTRILNVLQWAKTSTVTWNSWEAIDRLFENLDAPAVGRAMIVLLEDASRVAGLFPECQANVEQMKTQILTRARQALAESLQAVERAPSGAAQLRGKRPADVYRVWAEPVRWIVLEELARAGDTIQAYTGQDPLTWAIRHGISQAGALLRDILDCQSLPFAELDNPDWIDGYTGAIDDTYAEWDVRIDPARTKLPAPEVEAKFAQHGWSAADIQDFYAAQEGFNDTDGADEIFFDELPDDRDPQWMEMQGDLRPTDDLPLLRQEAQAYVDACAQSIREFRAYYERAFLVEREAGGERIWVRPKGYGARVVEHTKQSFRDGLEAKDFLEWLQEKAREGAEGQDLAVIFLGLQHGYGFDLEDAEGVHLASGSLYAFLEEWGDEILEMLNDPSPSKIETDLRQLDRFVRETIQLYAARGDVTTADITQHPAFLEGYFHAAFEAREIGTKDEHGFRNLAVEAGWEAWRAEKSTEGNAAFHRAKKRGLPVKEAMKEFWKVVNLEQRRQAEARIKAVTPSGLVLANGRKVDWRIAALKLEKKELELNLDERTKLRDLLSVKGWGLQFAGLL